MNQCADVCSVIVETVATIDHFNKAIFMLALILSKRYNVDSHMENEQDAQVNNTDNEQIQLSCAHHRDPITHPLIFDLYLL